MGTPALEVTSGGLILRFSAPSLVCVTGAPLAVSLDGLDVPSWEPVQVDAGATLALGTATGPGLRAVRRGPSGIDVPSYLGSASTFTLGGFGGHGGRALLAGDVLHRANAPRPQSAARRRWRTARR